MNSTEIGWQATQIAMWFVALQGGTVLVCWLGIRRLNAKYPQEEL